MKVPQVLLYNWWNFQFSQSRLKTCVVSKWKFQYNIVSKLNTYLCFFYCVLIGTFSLRNMSLSMKTFADLNENWYFILNKSRNSQLSFPLQPYLHPSEFIHYSEGLFLKIASHEYINILFLKLYLQDYLQSNTAGCLNLRHNDKNKLKIIY